MKLQDKGPITEPPTLRPKLQNVVDAVRAWPAIVTGAHWNEYAGPGADGVDFYVEREGEPLGAAAAELGHVHLEGELHLATTLALRTPLLDAGFAEPFPYARDWVMFNVRRTADVEHAVWLFRLNYDRLVGVPTRELVGRIRQRALLPELTGSSSG